jgi:hypothetical protein
MLLPVLFAEGLPLALLPRLPRLPRPTRLPGPPRAPRPRPRTGAPALFLAFTDGVEDVCTCEDGRGALDTPAALAMAAGAGPAPIGTVGMAKKRRTSPAGNDIVELCVLCVCGRAVWRNFFRIQLKAVAKKKRTVEKNERKAIKKINKKINKKM